MTSGHRRGCPQNRKWSNRMSKKLSVPFTCVWDRMLDVKLPWNIYSLEMMWKRLNGQVTCDKICPAMAPINTYHSSSCLFVNGQCLLSEEGTTQGYPLAMAMCYTIGTMPVVSRPEGIAKQTWYTDDSAAVSSLENLRRWWDTLSEICPLFPKDAKPHILVKAQS